MDSGGDLALGYTGEEESDDEAEDVRPPKPGGRDLPGVPNVASRFHLQTSPWKRNVS